MTSLGRFDETPGKRAIIRPGPAPFSVLSTIFYRGRSFGFWAGIIPPSMNIDYSLVPVPKGPVAGSRTSTDWDGWSSAPKYPLKSIRRGTCCSRCGVQGIDNTPRTAQMLLRASTDLVFAASLSFWRSFVVIDLLPVFQLDKPTELPRSQYAWQV
jgi:hypothetical protein